MRVGIEFYSVEALDKTTAKVFLTGAKLMIAVAIICTTGQWTLKQRSMRHCRVYSHGVVGGEF